MERRNEARIQELRSNLARCLQNGQTITAYFASLKKIWDELSNFTSLSAHGVAKSLVWLTREREEEKIHQFLMGLDDVYVTARSNLLARHPLPPLERVYELLLAQEDLITCCSDRSRLRRRRCHLPEDLLPDILSRLPVKSLLRFRCVSKPWRSLIDDDDFARLHLNAFNNNSDETRLFVVHDVDDKKVCLLCSSDIFERVSETSVRLDSGWKIVSSLDGLILLKSRSKNGMWLWNPSIREFYGLPPLPDGPSLTDIEIGLGYDPLAKDYKYVKLLFVSKTVLHSVAIYTVGAGSWKIIPFKGNGSYSCSEWRWRSSIKRNVHLKGSLYFIAKDAYDYEGRDLVSFDLSKEVFSVVPRKPDAPIFLFKKMLALVDGGSSVAVYDDYYNQGHVWVLDSKTMSWTKRCSYPSLLSRLLFVKKTGDILTARTHVETFSDKRGDVLSRTREEVASYSPQKQEHKLLKEYRCFRISRVCAYVESLILLNKSNTNI